jgi:hypothetical protein
MIAACNAGDPPCEPNVIVEPDRIQPIWPVTRVFGSRAVTLHT